jgi:hypothetical protein
VEEVKEGCKCRYCGMEREKSLRNKTFGEVWLGRSSVKVWEFALSQFIVAIACMAIGWLLWGR